MLLVNRVKFTLSVYRKLTFNQLFIENIDFHSFLTNTYKNWYGLHISKCLRVCFITIDILKKNISEKWLSRKLH